MHNIKICATVFCSSTLLHSFLSAHIVLFIPLHVLLFILQAQIIITQNKIKSITITNNHFW